VALGPPSPPAGVPPLRPAWGMPKPAPAKKAAAKKATAKKATAKKATAKKPASKAAKAEK